MFYYAYEKDKVKKTIVYTVAVCYGESVKHHCPLSVVHDFLNCFKNFGRDFYLKLSTAPIFLFSFLHGVV